MALEEPFQTVLIDQPSAEDTIAFLHRLKQTSEIHLAVRYLDTALVAAVQPKGGFTSSRGRPES